jgi:SagB-type dehydrogenase family enzyme
MQLELRLGSLAEAYHLASSYTRTALATKPSAEWNYEPGVEALGEEACLHLDGLPRLALPAPGAPLAMTLEEALCRRSSGHRFARAPLSAAVLAKLLWLANGARVEPGGPPRRHSPSAGGLGSVESFVLALDVEGVPPGVHHYDVARHDLAQVRAGDFRGWLRECATSQLEWADASALVVLVSRMARLAQKYQERAYRLGLLDAGHVSQSVYLAATALGLEVCALAGFVDDEMNRALGTDGLDRCPLLALAVGLPG